MNMKLTHTLEERQRVLRLSRASLAELQLGKLNRMLEVVQSKNAFYRRKFAQCPKAVEHLDALADFPFTYKEELLGDESSAGFAANLTYPPDEYRRFHRTSGTKGRPMIVLDRDDDWQWWVDTWQYVLDAAGLTDEDRIVMAFSFGPFIGFWSAFDAAVARGVMVAPAGGLSTLARLEMIRQLKATSIFCTPSYALHMVEVAKENAIEVSDLHVRTIVVAGEPGGSIPSIRDQIESFWNARVVDHSGASEIGPWGFPDFHGQGVHVNEAEFLPEFLSLETGEPAEQGELSELILTTLGREGCPVIRYRTGDLVRPRWGGDGSTEFVLLEGGVLGRTDDMMIIRGVNIFPTSIEQILRSFPEIIEYRLTAFKQKQMDELLVEVEDRLAAPERVAKELQVRLGLRVDVKTVPIGTLPRFEAKGKRFVDKR